MALAIALCMRGGAALADMELFVAKGALTAPQTQAVVQRLSERLGEPVTAVMEAADGRSFSARMMDGNAPDLAIMRAADAAPWAREGLLMALDGCAQTEDVSEAALLACTAQERLFAVPLSLDERCMAVRARKIDAAGMGYLLDARAHPVWYPSEVLQMLDELALKDAPGLALWPSKGDDLRGIEAFLQGVSGLWFAPEDAHVRSVDDQALEAALCWAQDMALAQLICAAESRETALARFIEGETAIFIDWTAEESAAFKEEIEAGEILLMPYPSMTGDVHRAGDLIAVCAPMAQDEDAAYLARRGAAALSALAREDLLAGASGIHGGAPVMTDAGALEGGATLRRLFAQALADVLSGEANARDAAGRVTRGVEAAR